MYILRRWICDLRTVHGTNFKVDLRSAWNDLKQPLPCFWRVFRTRSRKTNGKLIGDFSVSIPKTTVLNPFVKSTLNKKHISDINLFFQGEISPSIQLCKSSLAAQTAFHIVSLPQDSHGMRGNTRFLVTARSLRLFYSRLLAGDLRRVECDVLNARKSFQHQRGGGGEWGEGARVLAKQGGIKECTL